MSFQRNTKIIPDEPAATKEYEPLAHGSARHLVTRVSLG